VGFAGHFGDKVPVPTVKREMGLMRDTSHGVSSHFPSCGSLLKARLDNIAIVPASMLPLTQGLKEKVNTLPKGGVFLCYAQENTKQRKLLQRVEETFRAQGHVVRSLSMREVSKTTPNS
jgi:hypothetical protein